MTSQGAASSHASDHMGGIAIFIINVGGSCWLFWGCWMNNSGMGWTPLPLTLLWVAQDCEGGVWEAACPRDLPPHMWVRKLCQQQQT